MESDNDESALVAKLKDTFPKLKKVCDPIALNPTNKSNAPNLKSVISSLDAVILEKYSDYLLIPIFLRMSDVNTGSETLCRVLECLEVLLEYLSISNEDQFWKICSLTFRLIQSEADDEYVSNLPEELKLLVVKCLTLAFKRASTSILKDISSNKYAGRIGVIVFHSVRFAKNEKWVTLRVASLKLIQAILQLDSGNSQQLICHENIVRLISMMLPGIITCAVSVATSSDTVNHKVIEEAISLWGLTISLVMNDRKHPKTKAQITFKLSPVEDSNKLVNGKPLSSLMSNQSHGHGPSLPVITDEWLLSSGLRLAGSSEKMVSLHCHSHWRVRKKLSEAIEAILTISPNNMSPSVKYLVDGLIFLSQDVNDQVSAASKKSIEDFSKLCDSMSDAKKLVDIVEENFYRLITQLPRTLHGLDLSLKEKQLLLLEGYVDILGSTRLPKLLNSSQHLNRLLKSLYTAAILDSSNVSLLAEQALRNIDEEPDGYRSSWKILKCSDSEKYLSTLISITRRLSTHMENGTFIYLLCDDYENKPFLRKEITLLFIFIFSEDGSRLFDEDLVDHVLRTVMEPNLWELPSSEMNSGETAAAKSNVVQVCLLTELIVNLARAKGAVKFAPHLLECLYSIIECAGSPLYALATAGLSALKSLASLYDVNIERLLATNMDYLSYRVAVNLRHAKRNPGVLSVLSVMMKHSTSEGSLSLHEIIKDLLAQNWDHWQHVSVTAFLQVFLTFTTQLLDWTANSTTESELGTKVQTTLWDRFLSYYETTQVARDCTTDESGLDGEEAQTELKPEAENDEDNSASKIPEHITLTVDIVNSCSNYLPSKNISQQILVLQVLEKGVLLLSNWKDQLLPVVHKIWAPLVERFSPTTDPLIVHRSFVLLCTLAKTSKDFIRTRTMKSVIPFLSKYLKEQVSKCERDGRLSSHKMTQSYKLVLIILQGLGDLAVSMSVEYEEIELIVETVLPYLSCKQPLLIQEAATGTIQRMINMDPHVVWVTLMNVYPSPTEFKSRFPEAFSYTIEGTMSKRADMQKPIETFLSELI